MARPKEFEREAALDDAIKVFSSDGYEGASTEALLGAMGISRQSLYDTFGDKRRLYLTALERYNAASVGEIIASMDTAKTPLAKLETALVAFASRPQAIAALGCMGVMATCEFGASDPDIDALGKAAGRRLRTAFERTIAAAQADGTIDRKLDARAAAEFLSATIVGIKVAARGGTAAPMLRDIARMAIRSLK